MLLLLVVATAYADSHRFRTDADGPVKADEEKKSKGKSGLPEWYRLVDGQFPPQGSAHAVSGELIALDHLERRFKIRVDRNDSQDRGIWDLPLHAGMLPYGAIYYHNAPAALQDIPLGTHLHGLFYLEDPDDKTPLPDDGYYHRHTPESHFRRCFLLEDDFTFHARQKQMWEISDVDLTAMKLTATLQQDGKPLGAAKIFDLLSSTKVLEGSGFADLKSLAKGEQVQFDLTWVTLYGPGRVREIWIDDAARQLATAQQIETHHNYIRQRGLPGWVTAVDDQQQIVTIVFFAGVDPKLFDELTAVNNTPPPQTAPASTTSPTSQPAEVPSTPSGAIAVARESLMTYDPVNDRKGGPIIEIKRIPIEPGSSGVQIKVKCDLMLEGFRPRRIVRFYPSTWKVIALPREEEFFGSE
jgi:hypothetical protein